MSEVGDFYVTLRAVNEPAIAGMAETGESGEAMAAKIGQAAAQVTLETERIAGGFVQLGTTTAGVSAEMVAEINAAADAVIAEQRAMAESTGLLVTATDEAALQWSIDYSKMAADTARMSEAVVAANAKAAASTEAMAAKIDAAAAATTRTTAGKVATMKKVAAGSALVAIGVTTATVKMAGDFESATNRLVTSAGESHENLEEVRKGIISLAGEVGNSTEDLAHALYTIESGGQHGADGLLVLKAAAQGAKAENAELGTVADAVTSILQDYHLKADQSANVTSKLVAATSVGKTTFEELAGSMSAILPIASSAHIRLEDILGALGSMTVHGMSAAQASQNMADAVKHMLAPTQVQAKELGQLGMSAQDLAGMLSEKGLTGTVQELSRVILSHMGPSGKVMLDTLNQSRDAASAANTMLDSMPPSLFKVASEYREGSMSLGEFRKALKALPTDQANLLMQFKSMQDRASGFNDVLKSGSPAAQSYQDALRRVMGDATGLNVALMLTGENTEYVNHAVKSVAGATEEAGGNVKGWSDIQETFNQKLSEAKSSVGAMAVSIGTLLLPVVSDVTGAIADAARWFAEHKTAAQILATILGVVLVGALVAATVAVVNFTIALLANPVTWIVVGIVALIAGIVLLIKHWGDLTSFISGVFGSVVSWLGDRLSDVGGWFADIGRKIGGFFSGIGSWVASAFGHVVDFFASLPGKIGRFFARLPGMILDFLKSLPGMLLDLFMHALYALGYAVGAALASLVLFFAGIPYLIGQALYSLGATLVHAFVVAVTAVKNALVTAWNAVVNFFHTVPAKLVNSVREFGVMLLKWGQNAMLNAVHAVEDGAAKVGGFFRALPGKITSFVKSVPGALKRWGTDALHAARDGIVHGADVVWQFIKSIPQRIVDTLGDLGQLLWDAGTKVLQGFLDGLKHVWDTITGWISNIAGWISAHKGPIEYDATLLTPHGKAIMSGLLEGLIHGGDQVRTYLDGFTRDLGNVGDLTMKSTISAAVTGSVSNQITAASVGALTAGPGRYSAWTPPPAPSATSTSSQRPNVVIKVEGNLVTWNQLVRELQAELLRFAGRNSNNGTALAGTAFTRP